MSTRATAADAEIRVPELPCIGCGRAMLVAVADLLSGSAFCDNTECAARWKAIEVWQLQDRAVAAGQPDPNPPGWPRPMQDGRPLPWVTPVAGRAWWRWVHLDRLEQCQTWWGCQVCGEPLERTAVAVTDADRWLVTSACLHDRCARLALTICPALLAAAIRLPCVSAEDILVDGVPLPQAIRLLTRARWQVRPAASAPSTTPGDC